MAAPTRLLSDSGTDDSVEAAVDHRKQAMFLRPSSLSLSSHGHSPASDDHNAGSLTRLSAQGRGQYQQINKRLGSPITPVHRRVAIKQSPSSPLPREYAERDFLNPNGAGYGRMDPSPETVQRYSPISFGYNPLFPGQNFLYQRGTLPSGGVVVQELDPDCDLPPPPPSLLHDGDTDDDDDGSVNIPRFSGAQIVRNRGSPLQFQQRPPFHPHFNHPLQPPQHHHQQQQLTLRPNFTGHESQQLMPPPASNTHNLTHEQQNQLPVLSQEFERFNNPNYYPQLNDRPRLDITRLSPWQRRRQRPNDDVSGHQNEAASPPFSTSPFAGLNLRWHKDTNFTIGGRDRHETTFKERDTRNQSKSPKNRKKLQRKDSFKSSADMSDVVRSASEQNTPSSIRKHDQMNFDFRPQPLVAHENNLDKDIPTAGASSNTLISPDPSSPEIRFSVDQGPRPFFTKRSSSSEDAKTAPTDNNKSTSSSRARKKMKKKLKKKQKSSANIGMGQQQQQQQHQHQPESRLNDLKVQNLESRTLPTQLQSTSETKQHQDLMKYHRHLMNTVPSPALQRREGVHSSGHPAVQYPNPIFMPRVGMAHTIHDQRVLANDPNNGQMTSFGRFNPYTGPGLRYDDHPTRLGFSLRQPPPTPPRSPLLQYRWQHLQRHLNPNNTEPPLAANIRAASPESVDSNFSIPRSAFNNNSNNTNNGYKPATLPKNLKDLDISADDSLEQIRPDVQKSDNSEDPILFVDNTTNRGARLGEVPQNNNGYRSSSTSSSLSNGSHNNGTLTAMNVNGELLAQNHRSSTNEAQADVVGYREDKNFSRYPHSPTTGTFESFREYSLDLDGRPVAVKVKNDPESDIRKRKRKHMILIISVLMVATLAVAAVVVVAALGPWFGKGILLSKSSPTYAVVTANMTLKILNRKYHPDLSDPSTPKFAKLASAFTRELDMAFLGSNMSLLYCGSRVTQFSAGSVVAVSTLTFLDDGIINTQEDIEDVIKSVDDTHDRKSEDDVITLGEFLICRCKIEASLDFMTQREKPKVLFHRIAQPKDKNRLGGGDSRGQDKSEIESPPMSEAPVGGVIYQIPKKTSPSLSNTSSPSTTTASSASASATASATATTKQADPASNSKVVVTASAEVLAPPTQQYLVHDVTSSPSLHTSNTTTSPSSTSIQASNSNSTTITTTTATTTTTTAKPVDDNPFLSQHTTSSSLSDLTTADSPKHTAFKETEFSNSSTSLTTQSSAHLSSSKTTTTSTTVYWGVTKTTTTTAGPLTPIHGVISDAPAVPPTKIKVHDVKYHPTDRNVTVSCSVIDPHDWSVVQLKFTPVSQSGEVSHNSTKLVTLEPTGRYVTATVYSEQVHVTYDVTEDIITLRATISLPGYAYHGAVVCSLESNIRTRTVFGAGRLTAAIQPSHPLLDVPIDIVENKEVTPPIVCSTAGVGYPPWELSLQAVFPNSLETKRVPTTEQRVSNPHGPSYGVTLSLKGYLPALSANGTTLQCQLVSPLPIPLEAWSTPPASEDPKKSQPMGREALLDQQTLTVVEESICNKASRRKPLLPHPYICSRYIDCEDGKPRVFECSHNQCFDPISGECGAQSVFLTSVNGLMSEGLAGLTCTALHVQHWTRMRILRHRWGAMFDDVLEVNPQGNVIWHDQSLSMRALTDFRLSSVPMKVELALWIYNLSCEDEKPYRCELDRQGELTLAGASMLQVYARPSAPKLQVPNWLVETRSKRTLTITCEAVLGKPRATLTLMRRLQHEKHFRPVRFTLSTMQDEGSCLVRQKGVFRVVAPDISNYNASTWLCKVMPSAHAPAETGEALTSGEQWIHVMSEDTCSGQTSSALAIPGQCGHFVRCSREVASVKTCGEATCFNPSTQQCDLPLPLQGPDNFCGSLTGYFPHPYLCNKYIRCDAGRESIHDCMPGTIYSSSNRCTAHVHDTFCSKYIYR